MEKNEKILFSLSCWLALLKATLQSLHQRGWEHRMFFQIPRCLPQILETLSVHFLFFSPLELRAGLHLFTPPCRKVGRGSGAGAERGSDGCHFQVQIICLCQTLLRPLSPSWSWEATCSRWCGCKTTEPLLAWVLKAMLPKSSETTQECRAAECEKLLLLLRDWYFGSVHYYSTT